MTSGEPAEMFLEKHESVDRMSSHKSTSSNLGQDIQLADEVRKYPCLYDKQHHSYRRNDPSMEPWRLVANACEWIPNREEACRLFEVLKKRYSKKKMDFRRATFFATSCDLVNKTKEELSKYQFMSWMEPHIRHRTVKLVKDTEMYEEADKPMPLKDDFEGKRSARLIGNSQECSNKRVSPAHKPSQSQLHFNLPQRRKDIIEQDVSILNNTMSGPAIFLKPQFAYLGNTVEPVMSSDRATNCISVYNTERKNMGNDAKLSKKVYRNKSFTLEQKVNEWRGCNVPYSSVNTSYIPTYTSSPYPRKLLKNEDEVFSEMVLNEVKKLSGIAKCLAKHEIVNVLFNAQLRQYGKFSYPCEIKTSH